MIRPADQLGCLASWVCHACRVDPGWVVCRAFSAPEPLDDDVVLSQRIPLADLQKLYSHADRTCIGFEHENKNPRRTHAHINR